uniref:Uncharacterized protein n=1 Tax=Arundo donax TaxID=35708 RepID=A0A0A9AM38_ARUDO
MPVEFEVISGDAFPLIKDEEEQLSRPVKEEKDGDFVDAISFIPITSPMLSQHSQSQARIKKEGAAIDLASQRPQLCHSYGDETQKKKIHLYLLTLRPGMAMHP